MMLACASITSSGCRSSTSSRPKHPETVQTTIDPPLEEILRDVRSKTWRCSDIRASDNKIGQD
jgi:hypothetical protein